jgi:His/Glu/Gln/Arg/opine family amino acid ABC transporter permease subunit
MDFLPYNIRYIFQFTGSLLDATIISVEVVILSTILALLWGLVLVFPRMSPKKSIADPVRLYVEIMRNSPLLVQMYLIYFGLPIIGITLSGFVSGMVAIASQHGAFLSEVYRAGIESIPSGQTQGGLAIRMRKRQIMFLIVLPQAISRVLPSIGNELVLPAVAPGSSIIPGKVNPVIPEVVNQVAFQAIGNDLAVTMAAAAGQLQLNAMEPIITHNIFQSLTILTNAIKTLTHKCIKGITANRERCRSYAENSIGIITVLSPYFGYENSTRIAKIALETNQSIVDFVLQENLLSEGKLKDILSPEKMIHF